MPNFVPLWSRLAPRRPLCLLIATGWGIDERKPQLIVTLSRKFQGRIGPSRLRDRHRIRGLERPRTIPNALVAKA